jgi:N-acetylglucosamine-6-phosphate deacetylase
MTQAISARSALSGREIRLSWSGGRITESVEFDAARPAAAEDDWVAPAFWDIQFNGRWGLSFSDPALTPLDVARIVRAQTALGAASVCPTLITAARESTRLGLAAIAEACAAHPDVNDRVIGIHLEGPWISEVDGYRGAHPRSAVRDPDWDEFLAFQEASGQRIRLVTLAPERPGAIPFIRKLVESGVAVGLAHTAADGPTLAQAVEAGARLSTHLGNGIVATLPRHPNPIWDQAADDRLFASLIADGHHLGPSTLRVLTRAKGKERVILVSDASPLAGLPPGTHGEWAVDPSGKIVVAGTPYLAGSNQPLAVGLGHLMAWAGFTLSEAIATVTANPARLLGRPIPTLDVGQPAHLVRFRIDPDPRLTLHTVWVDGEPVDPRQAD